MGTVLSNVFVLFILFPVYIPFCNWRCFVLFYQSWSVPSQLESRSIPASWVEVNGPQKSGVASETRWNIWCVPLKLGSWISSFAASYLISPLGFRILQSWRKLELGIQYECHAYQQYFDKHSNVNSGLTSCSHTHYMRPCGVNSLFSLVAH